MTSDTAALATGLHTVPSAPKLAETLEMMLGVAVTVTDAGWAPPAGAIPVAVGAYVADAGTLRGCSWVDLPLAAAMGAAMSMVPVEQVRSCVASGRLSADFAANLQEVLNIASALLNDENADHLRIRSLELLADGYSADVLELFADPRAGGYWTVEVAGYGSGLFSITLGD